jgi:hypothetical protein
MKVTEMDNQVVRCTAGGACEAPDLQTWVDAVVTTIRERLERGLRQAMCETQVEQVDTDGKLAFGNLPRPTDFLQPQSFKGSMADAVVLGWADGEFGPTCPDCLAIGADANGRGTNKWEGDDLLTQVAMIASFPDAEDRRFAIHGSRLGQRGKLLKLVSLAMREVEANLLVQAEEFRQRRLEFDAIAAAK